MIKILEDNNLVTEILEKEWGCLPPHPQFGDIVAIEEDGEIKAFMCREILFHVGTVWVNPKYRKSTKGAKWLKELIKYVILSMPRGSSSIVLDETGLYGKLMKAIGFRKVKSDAYRMDFSDI